MKRISSVNISDTVTIDSRIARGVTYSGILDKDELDAKLAGNYSLAMASALPMFKWFPEIASAKLDILGHYYEPPIDIQARKAATLDKSIGHLLMSNLPDWVALPDRETSAMFYSNSVTANEFSKRSGEEDHAGSMFRAIPVDNARLVIAPAAHLRFSFRNAVAELGIADADYGSLGKLNSCFHMLLRTYSEDDRILTDWQLFLAVLQDIATGKLRPVKNPHPGRDTELLLDALVSHKEDIAGFLNHVFSPKFNGFTVVDFNAGLRTEEFPDNEIWVASPCLFIKEELFGRLWLQQA